MVPRSVPSDEKAHVMSCEEQGEPIRAHVAQLCATASLSEGQVDARRALSEITQATRAGLAEMDHLLDRAERLITQTRSHRKSARVLRTWIQCDAAD